MKPLFAKIYSTIVFDCDGVILDSNKVKTEAFRSAAMPYGEAAAAALVQYHVENGGVSRYKKFSYFLERIVPESASSVVCESGEAAMHTLLTAYAQSVQTGLMTCAVAEGLEELRRATASARWLIVSGGDQIELRRIFAARGLDTLFDGGIYGSPDTKDMILMRELASGGSIKMPAVFIGDSRYDRVASSNAGLDFIFLSGWSEFSDWQDFVVKENVPSATCLESLL